MLVFRLDPTLKVSIDPKSNQTIISGMGELHLEIYIERMKREYGVECITGNPSVNYKETITSRSNFNYLHKKQSGGSGLFLLCLFLFPSLLNFMVTRAICSGDWLYRTVRRRVVTERCRFRVWESCHWDQYPTRVYSQLWERSSSCLWERSLGGLLP